VPATIGLLGGQVVPVALLAAAAWLPPAAVAAALAATVVLFSPRCIGMRRFRQAAAGALLHPAGVLVAIQWHGFLRPLTGRPAAWKGRA
jgi:hypothetical protein